jgi:hypothetical protein
MKLFGFVDCRASLPSVVELVIYLLIYLFMVRLTHSLWLPFKLLNPPCQVILQALKKNLKVWHFLL